MKFADEHSEIACCDCRTGFVRGLQMSGYGVYQDLGHYFWLADDPFE